MALWAGGASARLVRDIGTAGAVQGFRATEKPLSGARLSTALGATVLQRAGDGGAQLAQVAIAYTLTADGATFSYSGNDANLVYATSGAFVLQADGVVYNYSGNNANLSFSGVPIFEFDTHDGDRQRRRFAGDREERKKRRSDIINAFEILVEGKSPIVEEIVEEFTQARAKPSVEKPRIDYDRLLRNIDMVERLWSAYLDMDDEEILLLL